MVTALLRSIVFLVSHLPLALALALGRALGWVVGSVFRYHRRDAIEALTRAFPDKPPAEIRRIVQRMYAHLGMNLFEFCRVGGANDRFYRERIQVENESLVTQALERKRGLLVLTAHMGNWDLLSSLAPRLGLPLTIITKRIKNQAVNDYWMRRREGWGLRFVPARNSYRQCLSALKRNELVGFILDQNMIRSEGIFVDFLGRAACTTPGLAYMSAQSGAPVLPAFMIREPRGHHRALVLPPIDPPPGRKPETIALYTQRYTRVIEDVIRQYPEQWIWLHRRWRTVPLPAAGGGGAESDVPAAGGERQDAVPPAVG